MSGKKTVASQISSVIIHIALGVILFTVAAMAFFVGTKKAYSMGYEMFNSKPVAEAPGTDKLFVVEKGMSRSECMDHLEKSGLIRDKNIALIQSYFFEFDIYPGTYTLNTSMTVKEILSELNEKPAESAKATERAAETKLRETEKNIEGDA